MLDWSGPGFNPGQASWHMLTNSINVKHWMLRCMGICLVYFLLEPLNCTLYNLIMAYLFPSCLHRYTTPHGYIISRTLCRPRWVSRSFPGEAFAFRWIASVWRVPTLLYVLLQGAVLTPGMDHALSIQPTSMMGPLTQQLSHLSMGSSGTVSRLFKLLTLKWQLENTWVLFFSVIVLLPV